MEEPICPHCQTPKSQWRENNGNGYPVDYCSLDCSIRAADGVQGYGTVRQEKKEQKQSHAQKSM